MTRYFLPLLSICLSVPFVGAFAETSAKEVTWNDLTVKVEFEDPFEALSQEQLMSLGIVARVKALQERKPASVSEGMVKEMEESLAELAEQGVDVEGLFAKREEIKQLRMKRATATNETLNDKKIRMAGYALALEFDGKKVREFLLVPWVGACIHTPPPPPNQIVHVVATEAVEVSSRFEPVWIEGLLSSGAFSKKLYLVDGSSDINAGYSMPQAVVSKYKGKSAPPEVRPAQH